MNVKGSVKETVPFLILVHCLYLFLLFSVSSPFILLHTQTVFSVSLRPYLLHLQTAEFAATLPPLLLCEHPFHV